MTRKKIRQAKQQTQLMQEQTNLLRSQAGLPPATPAQLKLEQKSGKKNSSIAIKKSSATFIPEAQNFITDTGKSIRWDGQAWKEIAPSDQWFATGVRSGELQRWDGTRWHNDYRDSDEGYSDEDELQRSEIAGNSVSLVEQLKELSILHESGAISDDEFGLAKQNLLKG